MNSSPNLGRPSPALADLFIPERTPEIAFWTQLAMGYGRLVINWHCGAGELALGLAQNGLRVVGIDPDLESIELARAREATLNRELMLSWLCHEPRLVSLPGPADFSILSDEVFGGYLNDDQRIGLLANLYHYTRAGGAVGLTIPLVPASGVLHNTFISGAMRRIPKGVFARRVSTLRYDAATSLLRGQDELLIRLPDGEQRFEQKYVRRLYTPAEIFAMLSEAGFVAIGMWGGWDRRPLKGASGAFIVRAERPQMRTIGKATSKK